MSKIVPFSEYQCPEVKGHSNKELRSVWGTVAPAMNPDWERANGVARKNHLPHNSNHRHRRWHFTKGLLRVKSCPCRSARVVDIVISLSRGVRLIRGERRPLAEVAVLSGSKCLSLHKHTLPFFFLLRSQAFIPLGLHQPAIRKRWLVKALQTNTGKYSKHKPECKRKRERKNSSPHTLRTIIPELWFWWILWG